MLFESGVYIIVSTECGLCGEHYHLTMGVDAIIHKIPELLPFDCFQQNKDDQGLPDGGVNKMPTSGEHRDAVEVANPPSTVYRYSRHKIGRGKKTNPDSALEQLVDVALSCPCNKDDLGLHTPSRTTM